MEKIALLFLIIHSKTLASTDLALQIFLKDYYPIIAYRPVIKILKQLNFWKNFGIIAIIIFAIFLLVKFSERYPRCGTGYDLGKYYSWVKIEKIQEIKKYL